MFSMIFLGLPDLYSFLVSYEMGCFNLAGATPNTLNPDTDSDRTFGGDLHNFPFSYVDQIWGFLFVFDSNVSLAESVIFF